jgi:hypothetical protein
MAYMVLAVKRNWLKIIVHCYSFGIACNQKLQPTVGKTHLKERGMLQMNIGVEFVL